MKDIAPEQIARIQRDITRDKMWLIIHFKSLAAFRSIELPELTSDSGTYKARSIYNAGGQSIKVFFYPPPAVIGLPVEQFISEPTRIDLDPEYIGA